MKKTLKKAAVLTLSFALTLQATAPVFAETAVDADEAVIGVEETVTDTAAAATDYTIHFDVNGGVSVLYDQVGEATQTITKSVPAKVGYNFAGWSTVSDPEIEDVNYKPGDKITLTTKELTLYAVWDAAGTLTCSTNTTTKTPSFKYYNESRCYTFKPAKSGYYHMEATGEQKMTINLWEGNTDLICSSYGDNAEINRYFDADKTYNICIEMQSSTATGSCSFLLQREYRISYLIDVDMNMFMWDYVYAGESGKAPSITPYYAYTVTYNANGGNCSMTSEEKEVDFKCWNTKADGTGSNYTAGASFTPSKDLTLYPVWELMTYETLPTATREGYEFTGWYQKKADGTESKVTANSILAGDVTLVAHWEERAGAYITYDANGGTNAPAAQLNVAGQAETLTKAVPTKSYTITLDADGGKFTDGNDLIDVDANCIFKTWRADDPVSGTTYAAGASYSKDGNVTMYANWVDPSYPTLPAPVKPGYTFVGWGPFIGNADFITDTSATVTDDEILYAQWKEATAKTVAKIITQPTAPSINENSNGTITVVAEGDGLTYQWQYKKADSDTWVNSTATGNKKADLTVKATSTTATYEYRCVLTDTYGNTVYTKAVKINMIPAVKITAQPESAVAAAGDKVVFSVTASNAASYQWQYSKDGAEWTDVGSGYKTLSITAKASQDGNVYRCLITGKDGKKTLTDEATLVVLSTNIQNCSAGVGQTASFTVSASSVAKYQWQYSNDNGATWLTTTKIIGYNTETISFKVTESNKTRLFRCKLTAASGAVVYTNTAYIEEAFEITGQPENVTAEAGEKVTFTVEAAGSGLTYQWQYSKDGGATWVTSTVTSAKTKTLSTTVQASFDGRLYRCIVKDAQGNSLTSKNATLTIANTAAAITSQPADVVANAGDKVTFSIVATGSGLTYQWQYSKDGGATWVTSTVTSAKTAKLSTTVQDSFNGRLYRCIVKDAQGNSVTSKNATLTIANAAAAITGQPANVSAVAGEKVTFSVTATGTGLTYQWQYSKDGGATWVSSTVTSAKTAKLSTTVQASFDGRLYRCIVKDANGTTLTSNTAVLTVA